MAFTAADPGLFARPGRAPPLTRGNIANIHPSSQVRDGAASDVPPGSGLEERHRVPVGRRRHGVTPVCRRSGVCRGVRARQIREHAPYRPAHAALCQYRDQDPPGLSSAGVVWRVARARGEERGVHRKRHRTVRDGRARVAHPARPVAAGHRSGLLHQHHRPGDTVDRRAAHQRAGHQPPGQAHAHLGSGMRGRRVRSVARGERSGRPAPRARARVRVRDVLADVHGRRLLQEQLGRNRPVCRWRGSGACLGRRDR